MTDERHKSRPSATVVSLAQTADTVVKVMLSASAAAQRDAERLQHCGLVYHERLISGEGWIGPPERHPSAFGRVKVLSLMDVNVRPRPNLRIQATDGERYLIPHDFKGTWFDVRSPTNKPLIK